MTVPCTTGLSRSLRTGRLQFNQTNVSCCKNEWGSRDACAGAMLSGAPVWSAFSVLSPRQSHGRVQTCGRRASRARCTVARCGRRLMATVRTDPPCEVVYASLPLTFPCGSSAAGWPCSGPALQVSEAAEGDRLVDSVSAARVRWFLVAVARFVGRCSRHLARHCPGWFAHTTALVARTTAERCRRTAPAAPGLRSLAAVQLSRPRSPCRHGRRVPDVLVLVVIAASDRWSSVVELSHST